nr:MAG TPA: FILAMIN A, INTEGRIN BETA-7 SUBUNIT PROTEIN, CYTOSKELETON-COMPLEX, ACTIN-BINDING, CYTOSKELETON [Caudoviricetes sp.]
MSGVKKVLKVSKPLKIFIHFLFLVMTDNGWQEESNPLYNHSSLRYRNHFGGFPPFEIIQRIK